MENDLNNKEDNDGTDNMYSYRDNSQNIKESGAIRRSMGDMNPNNDQNNNYNNKNDNIQLNISEKSSEMSNNNNNNDNINNNGMNLYWTPYLIIAIIEGIIILALALLFEREFELRDNDRGNSNCTLNRVSTINGNSTIRGNCTINGNYTINENSTISGNCTINENCTINGNCIINGNSTISGDCTINRNYTINGNNTISGNCTINGSSTINGNDINLYNFYKDEIYFNYGKLRDLNIMAFVGYGLLHTILQQNSWTSFSINTLILAISVQIAMFFNFVWKMGFNEEWEGENMDFYFINKAIFISCTISITYGSIIGKLSILQYVIMAVFEIILATMNFQLCDEKLETVDTGGALYVHLFGATFALSISVVLFCSSKAKNKIQRYEYLNVSDYFSNITSFLGLLILFVFFPSFNSALSRNQENVNRARINTYLSLFGSVVGSLVTSGILNEGRVVLEQIIYGTLTGGIIISGCCTVCFYHWAALILGTLSAVIAVVLLSKIKQYFIIWGLKDTCNVLIIHGIFGLLGGFITPMFISGLNNEDIKLYELFIDTGRSKARQAGIQVGGLFITLGISFVGGIATGFLMKVSTCNELKMMFTDAEMFRDFGENDFQNRFQIDDDKVSQPSYNN